MADPIRPNDDTAAPDDPFDDDLIGFATPRSLEAGRREPQPLETPVEAAAHLPSAAAPVIDPEPASPVVDPEPATEVSAEFGAPGATRRFERGRRRDEPGVTSEGDTRLALTIYACLIAAAPTFGVTVLLALFLAWTARFLVQGWTRSHLLFQLRTSLIGTIAGVVGVLTLPVGLGVFILSLAVVWLVARGAAGLYRLMRREPIRDPQTWSLP